MAKLGSLSYPDYDVDYCVNIARDVAQDFRGKIAVNHLAEMLNMSSNSGAFFSKVAALRDYGLLEGRGELRITPVAEKATHAFSEAERAVGKAEAFLRVDLFRRLYERISNDTVPDEDKFSIFLSEITQAGRVEVSKRASTIRRIYAAGARYLSHLAEGRPSVPSPTPPAPATALRAQSGTIQLLADDIQLTLPYAAHSIPILRSTLDILEERLAAAREEAAEA